MSHIPRAPIAFIVFNRPEKTARIFEAIRAARPEKLFIIADGPRREDERARCMAARTITEAIDWPCEVMRNYSEKNLGCKERVASGISWVFEHTDRAIFLEDDCLPDPSFFPFCEELLEKYKDDERVMHIGGNNFQQNNPRFNPTTSYYFSLIPHIWGWASWRRAWRHYDKEVTKWPEAKRDGILEQRFPDGAVAARWAHVVQQYYDGKIDSWDGQWSFACLLYDGLSIDPSVNLISNIGFDAEARHTTDAESALANIPSKQMRFPLIHPSVIAPDADADAYTFKYILHINRTWDQQLLRFFKSNTPTFYTQMKGLKRRFKMIYSRDGK